MGSTPFRGPGPFELAGVEPTGWSPLRCRPAYGPPCDTRVGRPPRPWVGNPHADPGTYHADPPPERSARCTWWLARLEAGWRPNRRWRSFGYYEASVHYGVWIWEYQNVLFPLLFPPEEGS